MKLELQPVHDALRWQLEPGIVRLFADLAENARPVAVSKKGKLSQERDEFFKQAQARCENLLRVAQAAYVARLPEGDRAGVSKRLTDPSLLAPAFKERLRAAMRLPAMEALFPAPWTAAARRMLPSASPQFTATAMWGPILAWCVLELLAESINIEEPERVALDLFDRLRLREPFAQSFTALGFEGEEAWRVAARIKVVLLTGAGVGKTEAVPEEAEPVIPAEADATVSKSGSESAAEPIDEKVALAPSLWHDPDVRWLTGVHEAEGHIYLVRELYEELLWWLQMPSLVRLAGEPAPSRAAVMELGKTIEEALATAEAAHYRIDELLGPAVQESEAPEPLAVEDDAQTIEEGIERTVEAKAQKAKEPGT